MKKFIIISLLFIILLLYQIDADRILNNKHPLFTINFITKKKELGIGPLYIYKREFKNNKKEMLAESQNVYFGPLFNIKKITYNYSLLKNIAINYKMSDKINTLYKNDYLNIKGYYLEDFQIITSNRTENINANNIEALIKASEEVFYYPEYNYHAYRMDGIKIIKCNLDDKFKEEMHIYRKDHKIDKKLCKKVCLYKKSIQVVKKEIYNDAYMLNLINLDNEKIYTAKVNKKVYHKLKLNQKYYLTLKAKNTFIIDNNLSLDIQDDIIKIEDYKDELISSKECI